MKGDEETEELTFLETVKIFEAEVLEKAIPLHQKHHEQVQAGILLFSDLLEKEKAKDKKIDTTQGANEKKANAYLDAMLNLPLVNEEERTLISNQKKLYDKGVFKICKEILTSFNGH